jgi:hypothetical protein
MKIHNFEMTRYKSSFWLEREKEKEKEKEKERERER